MAQTWNSVGVSFGGSASATSAASSALAGMTNSANNIHRQILANAAADDAKKRQATLDAQRQQELSYQHGRQATLDTQNKTLFDEKQKEYNLKLKNRNVLNTVAQNPDAFNASDIGKTQTDALIQSHFDKGNAAAENEIKQQELAGNVALTDAQKGAIYDKHNYGTTDPMKIGLINRQLQGVYDNNTLTREDGRKVLEQQIATAGGDLTSANTQSYIKNTIAPLPTRDSLVKASEADAKAINTANQLITKNRIATEKLKLGVFKANNPTTGTSGYGRSGYRNGSSYSRGRYNTAAGVMKSITNSELSTHFIKYDENKAKNVASHLIQDGANPKDVAAYIIGQITYGVDNTNGEVISNFDKTDANSIATLDTGYSNFAKKRHGDNYTVFRKNTGKAKTQVARPKYTMPKDILSYKQVQGMSYPEIQAASDKASRDKVAALFGIRAKKAVPSRKIITTSGTKKQIVSGGTGGTQKQVLDPAVQLGSVDRLQELQAIRKVAIAGDNSNNSNNNNNNNVTPTGDTTLVNRDIINKFKKTVNTTINPDKYNKDGGWFSKLSNISSDIGADGTVYRTGRDKLHYTNDIRHLKTNTLNQAKEVVPAIDKEVTKISTELQGQTAQEVLHSKQMYLGTPEYRALPVDQQQKVIQEVRTLSIAVKKAPTREQLLSRKNDLVALKRKALNVQQGVQTNADIAQNAYNAEQAAKKGHVAWRITKSILKNAPLDGLIAKGGFKIVEKIAPHTKLLQSFLEKLGTHLGSTHSVQAGGRLISPSSGVIKASAKNAIKDTLADAVLKGAKKEGMNSIELKALTKVITRAKENNVPLFKKWVLKYVSKKDITALSKAIPQVVDKKISLSKAASGVFKRLGKEVPVEKSVDDLLGLF